MKYSMGQFVEVKLIGPAKIEDIIDGTYFLFFFNGKRGQGWRDRDISRTISEKEFWREWRKAKAYA